MLGGGTVRPSWCLFPADGLQSLRHGCCSRICKVLGGHQDLSGACPASLHQIERHLSLPSFGRKERDRLLDLPIVVASPTPQAHRDSDDRISASRPLAPSQAG